ncbi:MAG: transporter substrate-binding domain-containing protein [Clostridiales bacterium]|nr:transporter substrate-binding domain-containing protein [Clostridiales bacterium]
MYRVRKPLLLALALTLAVGVMGLAGCGDAGGETRVIASVADLGEGDKIGVQSGTTGEIWSKENLEPKGVEVVPYDDILAAFAALQAGDVVGVINDLPISQEIVADETRGVHVVEEIETGEQYGFAFNQQNTGLRDAVNWALAEVIADGTYTEIYEKWFGAPPMSIPEGAYDGDRPDDADIVTLTPGKIIVGSDTAYPPFEFVEGGEIVGFDVDMMNAIGEKLGFEVEFLTYKFDALITDLQAGTSFDMVASAMTITEKRAQSVDFSDPYINSNQSLAVVKGD